MMSVAWGSLIGGFGTPAGNGPNPLAIGFMKDMAGVDVSFLDWMKYGVPISIILIPVAWGTFNVGVQARNDPFEKIK